MISDLILEEGKKLSGVEKYKYLGIIFNKDGNSRMEVNERIIKGRKITGALHSVLWDKTIRRSTKMKIYTSLVRSFTTYVAEVWDIGVRNRVRLLATEMDFLRRSCGLTRTDRVRNEEIIRRMNMDGDLIDEILKKQLVWFGQVKRMDEERIPKKALEWIPPERRKRGRPRSSWTDEVNKAMSSRNLEIVDVWDRETWKLGMEKRRQT